MCVSVCVIYVCYRYNCGETKIALLCNYNLNVLIQLYKCL